MHQVCHLLIVYAKVVRDLFFLLVDVIHTNKGSNVKVVDIVKLLLIYSARI